MIDQSIKLKIKKRGIAVDIDETLADTVSYWVKEMQKSFGNPENLSVKEMVQKYKNTYNVPYWKTTEALAWLEKQKNSNTIKRKIPLIKGADKYVKKIHKIVPISCYLTIRPEKIRQGTQDWLNKHKFPPAPLICLPETKNHDNPHAWKATVLEQNYPKIIGIIDDNPRILEFLNQDYKGTIYLYGKEAKKKNLKIVSCQDWEDVYIKIKNT